MRYVRILLVLVALTALVLIGLVIRHGLERTPESVVARARSLIEGQDPNFSAAFHTLELGLEAFAASDDKPDCSALCLEQMRLHRERWDRSLTDRSIVHDPADLDQVLCGAIAFLDTYDDDNREALTLGMQSALEAGQPLRALPLAQHLSECALSDRERSDAATFLGQTYVAIADQELEDFVAGREDLSPAERITHLEELRRVATRPGADPERMLLLEGYRSGHSKEEAEAAIEVVRRTSRYLETASASFMDALVIAPDEKAVIGLQDFLLRAGTYRDVIDLGLLSLQTTDLAGSTPIFVRTVRAMWASGHTATPRAMIEAKHKDRTNPFDYDSLDLAQFAPWCEALLALEEWDPLDRAALALRSRNRLLHVNKEGSRLGHFYAVIGRTRTARFGGVGGSIKNARPREAEELYPGQLMEYWWARKIAAGDAGDTGAARRALVKTTRWAPLELWSPRLRSVAGAAWLELGRAYLSERDWIPAEKCLSHALRFQPELRAEVEPLWERAGERALVRRGRALDQIRNTPLLVEGQLSYPTMGSFEACVRIETGLALGTVTDLTRILGPILDSFPGLPRALEASANGFIHLRHFEPAIEALLTLLENAAATPATLRLLEEIPANRYRANQVRRLVLADPKGTGFRTLLARRLSNEEGGADADPLPLLRGIDITDASNGVRLLGAEAWLDAGFAEEALRWFLETPAEAPELGAHAGLGLRCAAAVGSDAVAQVSAQLQRAPRIDDPQLGSGIDALIAHGHASAAAEFLAALDDRGDSLAPDVLLRWGLSMLLIDAGGSPDDAFERARAYLGGGLVDYAQLLAQLGATEREGQAERVRLLAAQLLNTAFAEERVPRALISALAGRYPEAWRLLEELDPQADPRIPTARALIGIGLVRQGDPPLPGTPVLDASDQPWYDQDPALGLALLLGSRLQPFAAWTVGSVDRLPVELAATPFADRVRALGWIEQQDWERADKLLEARATRDPGLAEVERLREHIGALRLAESSRDASGGGQAIALGAPAQAELEIARRLAREGNPSAALDHYDRVLFTEREGAADLLPEVMDLLARELSAGDLARPVVWSELDALEALYPARPSLPLALVQLRLDHPDAEPYWNVRRALEHLQRFRRRTHPQSVETLERGSARAWADFYAGVDTLEAGRFSSDELSARPESLELWSLWCRSLESLNRRQEALATYESLQSIVDDRTLDRGYASLLFDIGRALPEDLVKRIEANSPEDPQLALRLTLYRMKSAKEGEERDALRQAAVDIWLARAQNGLDSAAGARWLALALGPMETLGPANTGDPDRVAILDAAISEESDDGERALLVALRGLAAQRH